MKNDFIALLLSHGRLTLFIGDSLGSKSIPPTILVLAPAPNDHDDLIKKDEEFIKKYAV